jgi:hypothetical protein
METTLMGGTCSTQVRKQMSTDKETGVNGPCVSINQNQQPLCLYREETMNLGLELSAYK